MRLHETPIQDPGLGVQQIQAQIQNLCLEIQKLKQDWVMEVWEEVWSIKCRGQGHDKDHCPVAVNLVVIGGPTPLRPEAQARPSVITPLWCAICQVGGKHNTNNCHLLPKYNQTSQQLFCNFCPYEERDCHSYQLLIDQSPAYMMQIKVRNKNPAAAIMHSGFQGRGQGRGGMGPQRGHG